MTRSKYTGDHKISNKWFLLTEYSTKAIEELCAGRDGKWVKITMEVADTRSAGANRFYWGPLMDGYLREWPDYTKDGVHRTLGAQFLRKRKLDAEILQLQYLFYEKNPHGTWNPEWNWYVQSTSEMTVHAFWEYCEKAVLQLFDIGGHLTPMETESYVAVQKSFIKGKKDEF